MEAQTFPNDENGAVLRQLQEQGDDLSKARHINFSVVFPSERAARAFMDAISLRGHSASTTRSGVVPELPWDVTVVHAMVPTHVAICLFEEQLAAAANPLGGRNDGWGCFQQ